MTRRNSAGSSSEKLFQFRLPTAADGVDQDVDLAPRLDRVLDETAGLVEVGDVGAVGDGLAAGLARGPGDGLGRLEVLLAVHHHPGLLGPCRLCECRPESSPAAGDEDDPAAKPVFGHLPVTLTISVVVVPPRNTFSMAASLRVRSPSSRAAL